jgi:hypothetical protein
MTNTSLRCWYNAFADLSRSVVFWIMASALPVTKVRLLGKDALSSPVPLGG